MFKDLKLWAFILSSLSFLGVILGNVINYVVSSKIKDNHLKHLTEAFTNFEKKDDEWKKGITNKMEKLTEKVTSMSATCSEREKRIEKLENKEE